ncbi:SDR family oxidoreductase [Novosphingobium colocasiae]
MATRWFSDPLGEAGLQELIEDQERLTPLRRAGTPEDIAKAIIFLADEGSEHITGITLISDAGMHLGTLPDVKRN